MLLYNFILFLPIAFAAPGPALGLSAFSIAKGCSVSPSQVKLPEGLTLPSGEKPSLLTIGRGLQNYTCTSGSWVSAGAVADLYDVSCLSQWFDITKIGAILPDIAYRGLSYPGDSRLPVALDHYFVTSGSGIAPVFASKTNQVRVSRIASVLAPSKPMTNIPWLALAAAEGDLAKSVFRLYTVNGQPPSSCSSENQDLSVQYAAVYLFSK